MAIAQVQKQSGTGVASVTATFGSTPTQNNLMIAVVRASVTNTSIVLTGWTSAIKMDISGTGLGSITIWSKVAGASESTAVTSTASGASYMDLHIFEYSGLLTSGMLDKTASDVGTGGTVTSQVTGTTAATVQASELIIAAVGQGNSVTSLSWSNSVAVETDTTHLHTGSKIVSVTGTQTSTASWTTSRTAGGAIATFKASAAAASLVAGPPRARRVLMRSGA